MSNVAGEVMIVLILLLANGFFAMAEIAVISARKARLQQQAEEGNPRAQAALKLAQDPDDFLSTVQIGITLIGILAGAFGGATLSGPLADAIARVPALAPYAPGLAFALVVILITYLSLVIGELAPKRLALNNPERIAILSRSQFWLTQSRQERKESLFAELPGGRRFEVVDMDGRRVDKVLVMPVAASAEEGA